MNANAFNEVIVELHPKMTEVASDFVNDIYKTFNPLANCAVDGMLAAGPCGIEDEFFCDRVFGCVLNRVGNTHVHHVERWYEEYVSMRCLFCDAYFNHIVIARIEELIDGINISVAAVLCTKICDDSGDVIATACVITYALEVTARVNYTTTYEFSFAIGVGLLFGIHFAVKLCYV